MLTSIEIENFRCFEKLEVEGFRNFNLIGGLNNSGKTALLEAMLLSFFPKDETFNFLLRFRNENLEILKKQPENAWDYLFFNRQTKNTILINAEINKLNKILLKKEERHYLLKFQSNGNRLSKTISYSEKSSYLFPFFYSNLHLSDSQITSLYSGIKQKKKRTFFNKILKLLDPRIIGSEIDAPANEPILTLILENEEVFPLGMFGDAVRKVAELMLIALNSEYPVLFIDEIENGIHFTKHKELWLKLFEVAGDDIQIFATSHSAEMINAFNEAAHYQDENGNTPYLEKAMYFEMSRNVKNQRIIISPIDIPSLDYQIHTNTAYRGE